MENPIDPTQLITIEGYNDMLEFKNRYLCSFKCHPFPEPPINTDIKEMLTYIKRKGKTDQRIGIYKNISVIEAANRIATDLVLINGILFIIKDEVNKDSIKITMCLGNLHIEKEGDFTIDGKIGEAFNVSESLLKIKLNKTLKKWEGKELKYILINDDFNDIPKPLLNDNRIIWVKDWNSLDNI